MLDVVISSINIMQVHISRIRLSDEPPDILITPKLAQLGLFDFHRAGEAISEGERATEDMLPKLRALVEG